METLVDLREDGATTRWAAPARVALAVVGVGTSFVVATDGTWGWGVVRTVAVWTVLALVALVLRRHHGVGAAVLCTVVGLVATTGGLAFASTHLRVDGLSVRAVGALVAGIGGVALVVLGGAGVLGGLRGWRRVVAIPVGLLAAYLVAFPVAWSVLATNVPRAHLGTTTPADHGLAYSEVTFDTVDGVRLSGWYVPSRNGAAVVALHGASSTRSAVLAQTVVLARHGYGVLAYDARGAGRSGGRGMNFGWYGDRDVRAAVAFLARQPDVDPARIGAVGESMGGEQVLGAMPAEPLLRAVVAEGATNRVQGDWGWLAQEYGVRGGFQSAVNRVGYGLTDLLTAADPPGTLRDAARAAAPRPVLLLAAGDVPDEALAQQYIRTAAPDSVEVWVVEGSGHVGGLATQPQEWERRVIGFLDRELVPT